MKDEFKSLIYGIIHNPIFVKGLIGIVLVILAVSGLPVMLNGDELTMEEEYVGLLPMLSFLIMFLLECAALYMFCDDYGDKTLNYEILIGKSRLRVYISRIIVTLSVVIIAYLCVVCSVVLSISIWGFGSADGEKWLYIRLLMFGFEYIRAAAFAIFISQIVKDMVNAIGGVALMYAPMFLALLLKLTRISYLPASTAVMNLARIETQSKYNIEVGGIKQYLRYDWSLSGDIIAEIVITSILFTALYLFLGWIYFKKDDLP